MKRLFIAINLTEDIKKEIRRIIEEVDSKMHFSKQPTFRWLPEENWHLTLTFLGGQPDKSIGSILESIKSAVLCIEPPLIEFGDVLFAPQKIFGGPDRPPRMIWLTTTKQTSEILGKIKNKLEDLLDKNGVKFRKENRKFQGHLTLARFEPLFRKETKLLRVGDLIFTSQSLDLMESKLFRIGAEYIILEKVDF